MTNTKTIVFTHGLFVNNKSWNQWKAYFENKGFTVYTPANPFHEGNPADLRNNIHPELGKTRFETLVRNLADFIDTLPEKPIVIGHSLGGLTTMKLVEMGKVAAAVSIHGAPPKNVFAPWQTIKTVFPVLNFFAADKIFRTNKDWFHYAFGNNLARSESDIIFNEIAVPESRTVARDTLLKSFSKVNFNQSHAPLLFIGGTKDNIFPPSLTKKLAKSYKQQADLKIFEGRSHNTLGEKGWEEVAESIIQWLDLN